MDCLGPGTLDRVEFRGIGNGAFEKMANQGYQEDESQPVP
jgi:hypothetical protein